MLKRQKPQPKRVDLAGDAARAFLDGATDVPSPTKKAPATQKPPRKAPAAPKASGSRKTSVPNKGISHPHDLLPWEAPDVRPNQRQQYALRLPEPLLLKLRWLSEKTHLSINQMLIDAAGPYVDALVKQELKHDQ